MDIFPNIKTDLQSITKTGDSARNTEDNISDNSKREALQVQLAYKTQEQSAFFSKCPPEIRNSVYKLLLQSLHTIVADEQLVVSGKHAQHDWQMSYSVYVAQQFEFSATFLRTCRAMCHEAYPVLYGQNVFAFNSPTDMNSFRLRKLEVDYGK